MKLSLRLLTFTIFLCLTGLAMAPLFSLSKEQALERENQSIADFSAKMAQFYTLKDFETMRDITEEVLNSPYTKEAAKAFILANQRRIYVFKYPSDGIFIKGFISLTSHPERHPLLILFRWGNRQFGLVNPGLELVNYQNYTVISSTLRGGLNEGKDEFGGAEVQDMKNLIDFLPTLGEQLQVDLQASHIYMLGPSRGGLEMFLTLAHYPELQNRVDKVVALSAILDLHQQIQDRPKDMKQMFIDDFGLKDGVNEETWIRRRNPLATIPFLKKSLPILIIQGTADNRISLKEGHHMVQKLQESGHQVTYWEIQGGNHMLFNVPHLTERLVCWLESTHPSDAAC